MATAKTTYSVVTAEGKTETRKSTHPYTHALLGRVDYLATRAHARCMMTQSRENFAFFIAQSSAATIRYQTYNTPEQTAAEIAKYAALVAQHNGSADAYADAVYAQYVAKYAPEGQTESHEVVLRWSTREDLATKAISEFQGRLYTAFRVVAVAAK